MGGHGAGRGLAVCAGHAQAAAAAGDEAQHLGALVQFEAVLAEPLQFGMFGGDGGRIDHERGVRPAAVVGDEVGVLFVVQAGPFGDELLGQRAGGAVIAGHLFAPCQEIADEGAHADAAGADEIDGLYVFDVHVWFPFIVG